LSQSIDDSVIGGVRVDSSLTTEEEYAKDFRELVAKFKLGSLPARPDKIFAAVNEHDIDLLLLEELWSSPEFRTWLLEQVGYDAAFHHGFIGAWHSLSADTGESDVVLLVTDPEGRRCAVMIEDKIYASPQPEQSVRYRRRGDDGKKKGYWDRYLTCITAASAYLVATSEAALYDQRISHEAIRLWFETKSASSARANYKVALLTAAIERSRRGYVKLEIEGVTRFLTDYWRIAANEFPELRMPEPAPGGYKSQWVYFGSPAPRRQLVHKLSKGYVDLVLRGQAANLETLRADNRAILGESVALHPASKSAAFRVLVRRIDHRGIAGDQLDQIREGLRAAQRLLALSPTIEIR
jgi:hypothetical protein